MVHRQSPGIIFSSARKSGCQKKNLRCLGGLCLEQENPFVRLHDSAIVNLANYIKTEKQEQQ
jgi:hypothetical protein